MIKSWGATFLKLDRQDHYGKKDSTKKGNYKAIIQEAIDRYGSDPDIDRSKYDDNILITGKSFDNFLGDKEDISGEDLCKFYDSLVEGYRDPRGHRFRKDGIIAGAAIIKPAEDDPEWSSTSDKDKDKWLMQSMCAFSECFGAYKDNIEIDCAIIHKDERNPHIHIIFHDRKFALADKLGLGFTEELHRGAFLSYMKEKGYDLKAHESGISEDERQQIKDLKERIKDAPEDKQAQEDLTSLRRTIRKRKDKKNGRSSEDYKAHKDADRVRAAARQQGISERQQLIRDGQIRRRTLIDEGQTEKEKLINEGKRDRTAAYKEADQIIIAAKELGRSEGSKIKNRLINEGKQELETAHKEAERIKTQVRDAFDRSSDSHLIKDKIKRVAHIKDSIRSEYPSDLQTDVYISGELRGKHNGKKQTFDRSDQAFAEFASRVQIEDGFKVLGR